LFFGFVGADVPDGEGDCCLFLLSGLAVAAGHGDDFAHRGVRAAGLPGVFELGMQTGPEFGFVVLEVGHHVVPHGGRAEGFDECGCDSGKIFRLYVAEARMEVVVVMVVFDKWLLFVYGWD